MKNAVEIQLTNGLRKQPCGQQRQEMLLMSSRRKGMKLLRCMVVLVLVALMVMGKSVATDVMEDDERETSPEWSQIKGGGDYGEGYHSTDSCSSSNGSNHAGRGEDSSYTGSCSSSNGSSHASGGERSTIVNIDDEPGQQFSCGGVSSYQQQQQQSVRSFIVDDGISSTERVAKNNMVGAGEVKESATCCQDFDSLSHRMEALEVQLEEMKRELLEREDEDKTLLEVAGERIKGFVLSNLTPPTDKECTYSMKRGCCEPKCACGLQYRLGDYWLGRMCRLIPEDKRDPECDEEKWIPSDESVYNRLSKEVVKRSRQVYSVASEKLKEWQDQDSDSEAGSVK